MTIQWVMGCYFQKIELFFCVDVKSIQPPTHTQASIESKTTTNANTN